MQRLTLLVTLSITLALAACKKEEKPAAAGEAAKPAAGEAAKPVAGETPTPAAPAAGGAIASDADYESKAMGAMDKLTAIFAAAGKDCDKLAAEITKFGAENKALMVSSKAYEKDHPDAKKALDEKMKPKMEGMMGAMGPAMEACKDHKGLADAMTSMAGE
jgi:hypothetical protein